VWRLPLGGNSKPSLAAAAIRGEWFRSGVTLDGHEGRD